MRHDLRRIQSSLDDYYPVGRHEQVCLLGLFYEVVPLYSQQSSLGQSTQMKL